MARRSQRDYPGYVDRPSSSKDSHYARASKKRGTSKKRGGSKKRSAPAKPRAHRTVRVGERIYFNFPVGP